MGVEENSSGNLLLELLAAGVRERLEKNGIAPDLSASIAAECAEDVRDKWGGGHLYLPRGLNQRRRGRDRGIYANFTGSNYLELAKIHGLTEMRIRQIISRMRRESRSGAGPLRSKG